MRSVVFFLVVVFVSLSLAHVFPLGHHKHKATSLKAGPSVYPLQGDIDQYAEFFINISIGTPPQILRVQVDTGSTDLVVFATGCDKCPTAPNINDKDRYYNLAKSKTGDPIECDNDEYDCDVNNCWDDDYCPLEIEYGGGGSINGYAITDVVSLNGLSTRASLGLIQQISGPFENLGIDGCWGFAYEELSSWGDDPVVEHMIYDNKLYDSFSFCLTSTNPVMDIGVNYQSNTEFVWTDVTDQEWYVVEMEDFFVNDIYSISLSHRYQFYDMNLRISLGVSKFWLNQNGVIADTGTTLLIVSKKVMAGIQSNFATICKTTDLVGVCNATTGKTLFDGYCYPMTDAQVAAFPTISTTLKGITKQLTLTPQAYLWEGAGINGTYCLGLQYIEDDLPIILGDIFLQNFHVVFDRKEEQVGFGPLSTCPNVTAF